MKTTQFHLENDIMKDYNQNIKVRSKGMGTRNVRTKKYISSNDKFADLCNYFLFDGKSVIQPNDLKEKDVTELGIPYTDKGYMALEKIRDLLKSCIVKTAAGVTYLVIGIENQTDIHYAMVIRDMLMDALNYATQVDTYAKMHRKDKDLKGDEFLSGFAKTDKLQPVITITVYWGSGAWDGARCLHEMLDVPDKELLRFISNYKMNLIVPDEITDFNKFQTELGTVFEICQCANDKEKFLNLVESRRKEGFFLGREAVEMLNECVNVGIKLSEAKGDVVDMCKAVEDLKNEFKAEGRAEGELRMLISLVTDGIISIQTAASKAYMTEAEFEKCMENITKVL